jgi:mRNA interferase MazF
LARGDIVLVDFPFTDLSGAKLRPALIVARPSGDDFILAFLSSQTGNGTSPAEHMIAPSDVEFGVTGLKSASLIRLDKLATLHRALIQRRIGRLGPQTTQAVNHALRYVFML